MGGIQATMALTDLAVGFTVGVGAGCAVICGQYFGAHENERLSASVHTAMSLALVGGLFFSAAGLLAIEPILRLMGTPADLLGESLAYGRCYFGAMIFSLVMNMGAGLLRAVGDSRTPSAIVAIGCVINISLDMVLVVGMDLEALGCGIATAAALAANATMTWVALARAKGAWRLDARRLHIDPRIARMMLLTGLPLGVQSAVSKRNLDIQSVITTQVDAARESVAGVNIDEEMTNMLSFQHAYDGAARVLTVDSEFTSVTFCFMRSSENPARRPRTRADTLG